MVWESALGMAGGAWYDLGSYAVACAATMLGRPTGCAFVRAAAVTERHERGVDATTEGELAFPGNGTASFRVSLQDGNAKNNLVAIGTKGSIVIEVCQCERMSVYGRHRARVHVCVRACVLWEIMLVCCHGIRF